MSKIKKLNYEFDKISYITIFFEFLKLGLTSFGGPIAHIGFFREYFVKKKKWLDDNNFLDIVSFSNFLPGPSSSQVGMCIGYIKNGPFGALSAWLGFTLPSAIIMILSAFGLYYYQEFFSGGFLNGVKASIVIIVGHAVYGMSKQFLNDYKKVIITILSALILIFVTNNSFQIYLIIFFGVIGVFVFEQEKTKISKKNVKLSSISYLILFFILLFIFPILSSMLSSDIIKISDKFYRAGSLVFGGGHVVLPLLQNEILNFNLVNKDTFIFGYGVAQLIPGPMFTFSGFLGSSMDINHNRILVGIISIVMIFLPSLLLVLGAMPYWGLLRNYSKIRSFLTGVNACVVGLLISVLYNPIITSAINDIQSIFLLGLSFIIIIILRVKPWISLIIVSFIGKILEVYLLNFSFDFFF